MDDMSTTTDTPDEGDGGEGDGPRPGHVCVNCGRPTDQCVDCEKPLSDHGDDHEAQPKCESCGVHEKNCTCEKPDEEASEKPKSDGAAKDDDSDETF